MERVDRFKKAFEYLRYNGLATTQLDVAKKMGSQRSNISSALNGNERYLTDNLLAKFNEAFGGIFDVNWLINGEGSMLKGTAPTISPVKSYIRENLVNVPYVPAVAKASFVESLYDTTYDMDSYGVMPEDGEDLMSGDYIVYQINGDSMAPNIPNTSKVLAKKIPEEKWEMASGVIVIVYGKTLAIKRILKNGLFDGNYIILKADNPEYGQFQVERTEIRGMWQAIRIVSKRIV
nr:MAG TPA: putative transcriptional regulator [Caudoviricetes sp.]